MTDSKIMDISTEKNVNIVHPIDSRYRVPKMNAIWEEQNQLQQHLEVEAALAEILSEVKPELISKEQAAEIRKKSKVKQNGEGYVDLYRVKEIENAIHHDVMAMVKGLAEQC
ncbi:MAG: hypothetical protein GOV15_03895, partial [Candidatus Diapherotrites archaeon]|nr:hypothetical protein [Candidatus Diapherotrites archaeon]